MKHILIFTDGACRGNPGPGGWAALLRYGTQEKMISGGDAHTTNNRMELMAAIKALASLKEHCTIELYTDSQYVQKGITLWLPDWVKRQWKTAAKKPVKNADLWQELQIHTQKHRVSWHWVRGHNGHVENERVDIAANLAIDKFLAKGSKKIT